MTTQPTPQAIQLKGVSKMFPTSSGGVFTALRDLDLDVAPGEFCAVVGPTGCGKSTTLTLVSGLERPTRGTVTVEGRPVTEITPGVGFVFQNDAVFPWRSVLDNVVSGPRFRGVGKGDATALARDWLRRVGLPRPRKVQEIRFTDAFVALYSEIWTALRDEVQTAYARSTAQVAS